jgi:pilus assembly protein Flp/PilA
MRAMAKVHEVMARLLRDEGGATAIEYAMIAGGIAGAIILTVAALGTKVTSLYESVAAVLS